MKPTLSDEFWAYLAEKAMSHRQFPAGDEQINQGKTDNSRHQMETDLTMDKLPHTDKKRSTIDEILAKILGTRK